MTLLNVSDLSHHYAHGGFSGKHQHQAVLNNVSLTLKSGRNRRSAGAQRLRKKHSRAAAGRLRVSLTREY